MWKLKTNKTKVGFPEVGYGEMEVLLVRRSRKGREELRNLTVRKIVFIFIMLYAVC